MGRHRKHHKHKRHKHRRRVKKIIVHHHHNHAFSEPSPIETILGLAVTFWPITLLILFGAWFAFVQPTFDNFELSQINHERIEQGLPEYSMPEFIQIKQEDSDKQAFEKLNEVREEYGKHKLTWNTKVYELVKFQASKKLCSSSHCSHEDSQGKYFDDYAGQYDVSLYNGAGENIASGSCDGAIGLWLNSTTGHKEIMLDSGFTSGALAYDEGNCVFIGIG